MPSHRLELLPASWVLPAQDGSILKRRVYHWRAAMEYFLIGMWRQCVPLLDEYDVVGATRNQFTTLAVCGAHVCKPSKMRVAALSQQRLPP